MKGDRGVSLGGSGRRRPADESALGVWRRTGDDLEEALADAVGERQGRPGVVVVVIVVRLLGHAA